MVGAICVPLNHRHWEQVAYAVLGVLVFFAWILYDTGQIINDTDDGPIEEVRTPGLAAFALFLDIVALRDWLTDLLELVTEPRSEK